ncbi:MAG TPA: sugar ABC transporter permease [Gaiellaceae bacterium]|nr:sugar ABC transporter permease [Gaiellaceae bacterium]
MATVAQPATLGRRLRRWEGLPYALILPTVAYLGLFFAWPMVQAFELAFHVEGTWTVAPFRTMANDVNFNEALGFTLLLVGVIVPVQFVLALAMALIVNAKLHGRGLFLAIFILPLAISDLAAGLVWQAILTERGYLNTVLEKIGLIDQEYIWLDPTKSNHLLIAVVVAELWRSTAFVMVIFLAGLQGIPHEYTEAAEVFGAGFFQRVRQVTLPLLKPSIQVALLFRIIFAFEAFAVIIAITGRAKQTLATEAWRWQAEYFDSHVAAAYSALILLLSLISAGLVVWLLRTPREQMLR